MDSKLRIHDLSPPHFVFAVLFHVVDVFCLFENTTDLFYVCANFLFFFINFHFVLDGISFSPCGFDIIMHFLLLQIWTLLLPVHKFLHQILMMPVSGSKHHFCLSFGRCLVFLGSIFFIFKAFYPIFHNLRFQLRFFQIIVISKHQKPFLMNSSFSTS